MHAGEDARCIRPENSCSGRRMQFLGDTYGCEGALREVSPVDQQVDRARLAATRCLLGTPRRCPLSGAAIAVRTLFLLFDCLYSTMQLWYWSAPRCRVPKRPMPATCAAGQYVLR